MIFTYKCVSMIAYFGTKNLEIEDNHFLELGDVFRECRQRFVSYKYNINI